jgi:hypothetical protein
MKHLAAYLLLGLGGNTEPSAKDIKGVLESVGIDADDDRLEKLIGELKGKDLQEVRACSLLSRRSTANQNSTVDCRGVLETGISTIWRIWGRRGGGCSFRWSYHFC